MMILYMHNQIFLKSKEHDFKRFKEICLDIFVIVIIWKENDQICRINAFYFFAWFLRLWPSIYSPMHVNHLTSMQDILIHQKNVKLGQFTPFKCYKCWWLYWNDDLSLAFLLVWKVRKIYMLELWTVLHQFRVFWNDRYAKTQRKLRLRYRQQQHQNINS